jgi:hypothetical protein
MEALTSSRSAGRLELAAATLHSPLIMIIGSQNRKGMLASLLLFRAAITRAAEARFDRIS